MTEKPADAGVMRYMPHFGAAFGTGSSLFGMWLAINSPSHYEYGTSRSVDIVVFIGGGLFLVCVSLFILWLELLETRREVERYHA